MICTILRSHADILRFRFVFQRDGGDSISDATHARLQEDSRITVELDRFLLHFS